MNEIKEYIESLSNNGSYTKASLDILGVPWPPPSGWKENLLKEGLNGNLKMRQDEFIRCYKNQAKDVLYDNMGADFLDLDEEMINDIVNAMIKFRKQY